VKLPLLALLLVACSGSTASPLYAETPDAAPVRPVGASLSPSLPDARSPRADAPTGREDAGEDVHRLPVSVDDAGKDSGPSLEAGDPVPVDAGVDAAGCQANACSGFSGACGAVELECAGTLFEYSCGSCGPGGLPGTTELACGDNGDLGQCGNTCLAIPTSDMGNTYWTACSNAGDPTGWVVPGNCTGTPWRWEGGPAFRSTGRAGCVVAPYAGDPAGGVPSNVVCCPP
jgi:hypothetical protein